MRSEAQKRADNKYWLKNKKIALHLSEEQYMRWRHIALEKKLTNKKLFDIAINFLEESLK